MADEREAPGETMVRALERVDESLADEQYEDIPQEVHGVVVLVLIRIGECESHPNGGDRVLQYSAKQISAMEARGMLLTANEDYVE
jgi:hypothetical protein